MSTAVATKLTRVLNRIKSWPTTLRIVLAQNPSVVTIREATATETGAVPGRV